MNDPWAGFSASVVADWQYTYERKIINYLFARYEVSKATKNIIYNTAEQRLGSRTPTLEIVEQFVPLPLTLRCHAVVRPQETISLASLLNGKAFTGALGKAYLEARSSLPEDSNHVIGLCFPYPYLKVPNSAASLVLHDAAAMREGACLFVGPHLATDELWVVEPLRNLLDWLDQDAVED